MLLRAFLGLLLGAVATFAQELNSFSEWQGLRRADFSFEVTTATVVFPKEPAAGRPWIWRTEFFGHEPQADLALAAAGWHVAYVKVSDQYGAPVAIERMARFREYVVKEYQLGKAVLEGFSRGDCTR